MPEVAIRHTPAELAELFALLDDAAQAEFFNALAVTVQKEYPQGIFGFATQMEMVRDLSYPEGPALNADGMTVMKIIGGDY